MTKEMIQAAAARMDTINPTMKHKCVRCLFCKRWCVIGKQAENFCNTCFMNSSPLVFYEKAQKYYEAKRKSVVHQRSPFVPQKHNRVWSPTL